MEVHGKRAESDEKSTSKGIQKFCQPCEYKNVTTKAHGICLECEEYMCNTCFRNHQTIKLCRHHVLVGMDKASLSSEKSKENEEKCSKHGNEGIKLYCREHDIVGCGDCIILEHSTCKPEYIKDLSKGFQDNEEFKGLMRKLDQLQSTNQANDEKVQKYRKDCKVMHEDALKEIRKFRADINKYLDKAESDIITETEQLKRDNDTLLDKIQQECVRISSEIDTLKHKLNTLVDRENALFIHTVNCKPIVKKTEQEVAKVMSENKVKQCTFFPDEQLIEIVTTAGKFGHLNTSETSVDEGTVVAAKGERKPGSEVPICQATANVMTYDDTNRKWSPSGSSPGLSKVQIYQHTVNNTFRVVGRKLQDHEVVINCAILKNLKYNLATPTFHQWRDSRHVYGLSFASKKDSTIFAKAMLAALDTLNNKSQRK